MAKQQSDNIEDRFREAAENISFPPNSEAWDKMQALLDKDKRRRPVFAWWFLLLFGLLAGAGVFTYRHFNNSEAGEEKRITSIKSRQDVREVIPGENEEETSGSLLKQSESPIHPESSPATSNNETPDFRRKDSLSNSGIIHSIPRGNAADHAENTGNLRSLNRAESVGESTTGSANKAAIVSTKTGSKDRKTRLLKSPPDTETFGPGKNVRAYADRAGKSRNPGTLSGKSSTDYPVRIDKKRSAGKADQNLNTPARTRGEKEAKPSNSSLDLKPGDSTDSKQAVTKNYQPSVAKDQTSKPVSSIPSVTDSATRKGAPIKMAESVKKWNLNNGFNFSLGARIDATDLHKISLTKFNQLAGATIGYRFSNRLSLQTGVFVQKAVYFAGPQDYYVKPGSYLSYYRISKIDAVCQIYEIPLNVRYDLLIGKGLRVYAVGGINSFYMKKENYRYHATNSSGYRMFDSTYRENKNLFSSVYFAAGVEKKITPVFSVLAEPYAKLPITGVGAGKVKLYSGGIQLMLRYQPQSNKKSSQKK